MNEHKHLTRLPNIIPDNAIFFITTVTYQLRPILANALFSNILIDEWRVALPRHGWIVGRYVIMPDHVHFFCSPAPAGINYQPSLPEKGVSGKFKDLSGFMQQWKQWTSKRILGTLQEQVASKGRNSTEVDPEVGPPIWQEEFFDHLLRSHESYAKKWEYVCQNPVRKGLVKSSTDWIWQGEIYQF